MSPCFGTVEWLCAFWFEAEGRYGVGYSFVEFALIRCLVYLVESSRQSIREETLQQQQKQYCRTHGKLFGTSDSKHAWLTVSLA